MSLPQAGRLALVVRHTWDGRPLPEPEHVTLSLRARPAGLEVRVDAPYFADPPPHVPTGPTPKLWEYEVVELFLAPASPPPGPPVPYTEIELGPHGHYLVLRLRGVRQVAEDGLRIPYCAAILDDRRWRAATCLPWALLPEPPLRANAYAMHGAGSSRKFLAMAPVPGERPDFHQLERFQALPLERPVKR